MKVCGTCHWLATFCILSFDDSWGATRGRQSVLCLTVETVHNQLLTVWMRELYLQSTGLAFGINIVIGFQNRERCKWRHETLTLASIRKPVKVLRMSSILSPESSTDSASNRWRSPSRLNHCCICRQPGDFAWQKNHKYILFYHHYVSNHSQSVLHQVLPASLRSTAVATEINKPL